MAMIDPEQERRRLRDFYSRQMDGRKEQIGAQAAGLTDLAREVLRQELIRRGLDPEPLQPSAAEKIPPPTPVEPRRGRPPIAEEQIVEEPSFSGEFEKRNLIPIRKFRDLPEALLAKGGLDSAGIECFLCDENRVRLHWFISNLLGGIKLLVNPEDAAVASEILSQPIPENFDVEGVGDFQQPRCPQCQSVDVSFEELYKPIAYGSLFASLPIPVHRQGWICHSCGYTWQEEEAAPDANPI